MEDIFALQHAVQGQLNQKSCLAHTSACQYGTKSSFGEEVFGLVSHEPQRVSEDKIFFKHIEIPVL